MREKRTRRSGDGEPLAATKWSGARESRRKRSEALGRLPSESVVVRSEIESHKVRAEQDDRAERSDRCASLFDGRLPAAVAGCDWQMLLTDASAKERRESQRVMSTDESRLTRAAAGMKLGELRVLKESACLPAGEDFKR